MKAMSKRAFFSILDDEGILAVRGPEAAKFLQGQLTCNLNYLNESRSSLGARCNAKGRMLSSFRIAPHADGYMLAMDRELVLRQLDELKKYAVFSKCSLADESANWIILGLYQAEDALAGMGFVTACEDNSLQQRDGVLALRLDSQRWQLWLPQEHREQALARLSGLEQATAERWRLVQIQAGEGQVTAATSELFIPQMLNLQSLGGVSFKKGCYTGQEIVARMQYLGKLKRRMYRFQVAGNTLPAAGTELFSSQVSSSIGNVVLAAPGEQGMELLAVAQNDCVEAADVRLSATDGAVLQVLDLPYQPDADQDIKA